MIKIEVSLLSQKKLFELLLFSLWNVKNIPNDKTINANKNINIKIPLAGSLANVCTEFNIPDLTKKVPHILRVNVVIDNITTQDVSAALLSNTTIQCNSAVNVSHGIKETFSTGSQNQKPPHPSS